MFKMIMKDFCKYDLMIKLFNNALNKPYTIEIRKNYAYIKEIKKKDTLFNICMWLYKRLQLQEQEEYNKYINDLFKKKQWNKIMEEL